MNINRYRTFLYENERSKLTIEKYTRDVLKFIKFSQGRILNKQIDT